MGTEGKSWYKTCWRPSIAWSYLIICMFDFFLAPIGNAVFQASFYPTASFISWVPITLGGGGLYHISMMTIVGVTAWGRTQEKVRSIITDNANIPLPMPMPFTQPEKS